MFLVTDLPRGDRKPKVDLLKTCINCIPRLMPYEMSRVELIELLARVSLNVDEEIRMMAQQTMVNLIIESPAYRQRTIQGSFPLPQTAGCKFIRPECALVCLINALIGCL